MRWVVSYDIVEDGHRRKMARILETWGIRVQYSIFECDLAPEDQRCLSGLLKECLDVETDSLRWYPLCNNCLIKVVNLGGGVGPVEGRVYYLV